MDEKKIEERYGTEDNIVLPRFVWEDHNASHERTVKRLIIALIVAISMNFAWLWVFTQYDFTSETTTIENSDEGNTNYLEAGNDGEINNGIKDTNQEEDGNEAE